MGSEMCIRDRLWTLLHLKFTKHIVAENGGNGGGSRKYGSNGKDAVIEVPLGTIANFSNAKGKKIEIIKLSFSLYVLET